jgi:hypothetical protein
MGIRSMLGLLVCSVALLAPEATAFADDSKASAKLSGQPNAEGDYGGVAPGTNQDPRTRPKQAAIKGTLSWLGFASKDGGAEVFFQSAAAFEIDQRVDGGVLSVRLRGLTKQVANTRRAIDTRFFDNPLARISAKVVKGKTPGIDVRITFKNAKDAKVGTMRTATEADGFFYVYLSFPEGAEQSAAPGPANGPQ